MQTIPILSKEIIRKNFEDLKSLDLYKRRWFINSSGGSTGEPVKVIQDNDYLIHSEARKLLSFSWAGLNVGEHLIRLWGSERDILGKGVRYEKFKDFIQNRKTLNSFILTPNMMEEYIQIINKSHSYSILAYANAAYEISKYGNKNQLSINKPKTIISTSGNLHSFIRDEIEKFFNCNVFDQYGSREVSCIASECSFHEGLHVSEETMIVEIVDDNGSPCEIEQEGDILVTSLMNYSMPLIRYKIGDRGIFARGLCKCGKPYKRLKSISGRKMDNFKLIDGTIIPSEYFIHFIGVVLNKGSIKKVQLIQKKYDLVHLKLVYSGMNISEKEMNDLIKSVRDVMGKDCEVKLFVQEDILPSPSGKFRYTICEI